MADGCNLRPRQPPLLCYSHHSGDIENIGYGGMSPILKLFIHFIKIIQVDKISWFVWNRTTYHFTALSQWVGKKGLKSTVLKHWVRMDWNDQARIIYLSSDRNRPNLRNEDKEIYYKAKVSSLTWPFIWTLALYFFNGLFRFGNSNTSIC
jgi:hypothetical protein